MTSLSATSPQQVPALPDEWAERIFQRLENFYLAKWVDAFGSIPRERVKQAWAEELAGYSAMEIKRGLDACKAKPWPPTLPEFLLLCRPVIDAKTEWMEACEQMRVRLQGRGGDTWSRPQVYWAAVNVGWYDLNNTPWEGIRGRWLAAIAKDIATPIPDYLAALPAPGKQAMSKEDAEAVLAKLKRMVSERTGDAPQSEAE